MPIFQFSSWNKIFDLREKGHKPRQLNSVKLSWKSFSVSYGLSQLGSNSSLEVTLFMVTKFLLYHSLYWLREALFLNQYVQNIFDICKLFLTNLSWNELKVKPNFSLEISFWN